MVLPEDFFWEILDRWQLPFRVSCRDLVTRYGTEPSVWLDGVSVCRIPCHSDLEHLLAEPWQFDVGSRAPMSQVPGGWFSYVRQSENAYANLQSVFDVLSPILGPAVDVSCSNTRNWEWRFGHAIVSAIVFPPELNTHWGHNSRHDLIPGSETECAIRIHDRWRELMPKEHLAKYEEADRIWNESRQKNWDWIGLGVPMQLPNEYQSAHPGRDLRMDLATGDLYLRAFEDVCWWIRKSQIARLEYTHLMPAKGPGHVWLVAKIDDAAEDPQSMFQGALILADSSDHMRVLEASRSLADALQVQLDQFEDYDC